ncbi:hypothetical protein [Lysinibacillus odysseyi]|uniref:DUF4367 domain-containing protein n=1 Tax=Lysinibacillus odysseyi 34hs-1 = NBRC 100172 TaxID=1220589 RepID=A0A0A3IEI9_9BACI|nr:hypothetical protein [Lysinibacillus odysseyi]KGR81860.1 hypothetical protein CD32_21325 [Lysinibacillus odysseyi 34hs-1 = NBRC 100172]
MNNIKRELEKIEIPKELNNRAVLGVKQAKMEKRKKKRHPKWILGSVASVMIIGASFTIGGSYIADAAQSLISQLFGSKGNLMQAYPNESEEEIDFFEQHMIIAKENLTEEEFNKYSRLFEEQSKIWSKVQNENREPDEEEAKRLHQIGELQKSYENKFALIEAQQFASYSITKPTHIPEGYKQVDKGFSIVNKGEEPIVSFDYSNGEAIFSTQQTRINQQVDIEKADFFRNPESYFLKGFQFDYVPSKEEWPVNGMRVTVPEKRYKVIIMAYALTKEEMENVLLSMIEK